jgi:hypothetical protein
VVRRKGQGPQVCEFHAQLKLAWQTRHAFCLLPLYTLQLQPVRPTAPILRAGRMARIEARWAGEAGGLCCKRQRRHSTRNRHSLSAALGRGCRVEGQALSAGGGARIHRLAVEALWGVVGMGAGKGGRRKRLHR